MPEERNSAWLRKTLCDEIESVRSGKSDHVRAKSVALLAREVLKSVEVEMVFRQQQGEMNGTEHEQFGALPLCLPALPAPEIGEQLPENREAELERAPIRSPLVPPATRFVAGRAASGSR